MTEVIEGVPDGIDEQQLARDRAHGVELVGRETCPPG
jgi:hypothetical protein